jgi:preprotein translocase subunit YajC
MNLNLALLAQQQQPAGGMGAMLIQFVPFILIFVIFYFLLIRPQRQRQKAHEAMIQALTTGDHVITQGGMVGTVTKVEDNGKILKIKLAPSVEIRILRTHIASKAGEDIS